MLSESCYGFRCNLNYIDFLERHTTLSNDRYFLRLDISNFFESISMELLIDVLSYYIEDSEYVTSDESNKIVYYIKEIVTFDDKLVQGIATSPIISNIVFRQLDIRNLNLYELIRGIAFFTQNKEQDSWGFFHRKDSKNIIE